jgi:uncharacterized protein (DUF4415 family)
VSDADIRRASLTELRKMKEAGKLFHRADAPEGEEVLDARFWQEVRIEAPRRARSVHLKIDPDVFDYFFAASGGKGHLTRMQNVLKAFVKAQKAP